jgi:hypothetical protein
VWRIRCSTEDRVVDLPRLIKGIATSKTLAGIVGTLAVTLASGGDLPVTLTVKGVAYDLGNVAPYIVSALSALAAWGRLTASGPIVTTKAPAQQSEAEPRGFPRA